MLAPNVGRLFLKQEILNICINVQKKTIIAVFYLNGSVKEPNKFHNYETEKITRKASDTAEYIKLFVSSTWDRHAWCIIVILWTSVDICVVVHDDLWWKNRTTYCNRFWRACRSQLEYVDIRLVY